MNNMKTCIQWEEIRKTTDYENWPEECWPNCIFTEIDYPCRKCSVMQERYKEYLKESIESALQDKSNNIHYIIKSCKNDGGKIVKFRGLDEYGLLVGATSTLEDYYWIYIDKDKKLQFDTCVSGYDIVNDIPEDCKFLTDINNGRELLNIVIKGVNATLYDMLITPIYINTKTN